MPRNLKISKVQQTQLHTYIKDKLYRTVKIVPDMKFFTEDYPKLWNKVLKSIGITTELEKEMYGMAVFRALQKNLTSRRNYNLSRVKSACYGKKDVSVGQNKMRNTNHAELALFVCATLSLCYAGICKQQDLSFDYKLLKVFHNGHYDKATKETKEAWLHVRGETDSGRPLNG